MSRILIALSTVMNKTTKRLLKLAIILIFFLLLFILIKNVLVLFPARVYVFASLKKEPIQKLVFTLDKKKITVTKKNNQWTTENFPADFERIEQLVDSLINLKKDDIASQNKNTYAEFAVEGKRKIEFNSHVLYIGSADSFSRTYFRADTDPLVYISTIDFSSLLAQEDFRELNVLLITDESKVNKIVFSIKDKTIEVEKKKDVWMMRNGKKAKKEQVDFWINDIKTLKGNDIFAEKSIDFSKRDKEMTISIKEGDKEKKGVFYKKDEDSYYFHQEKSGYIYYIPAVSVTSVQKEEKDLIE